MAPLLLTGLSIIPKIPSIWEKVSKIFKKKTPTKVNEAISLVNDIKDSFKKGEVSPEMQKELEMLLMEHEEEMAKIALEKEKVLYEDLQGMRDLEIAAYNSGDQYVARTRPKILRDLFKLCAVFSFFAPLVIIVGHLIKLSPETLVAFIAMVRWIGGFLFSTFISGYLGYSAARSIDKRNPTIKDKNDVLGKIIKNIL